MVLLDEPLEKGVTPTEGRRRVDPEERGRFPNAQAVRKHRAIGRPEREPLRVRDRGAGQIAERASAVATPVSLATGERPPSGRVLAGAARAVQAATETAVAQAIDQGRDRVGRRAGARHEGMLASRAGRGYGELRHPHFPRTERDAAGSVTGRPSYLASSSSSRIGQPSARCRLASLATARGPARPRTLHCPPVAH